MSRIIDAMRTEYDDWKAQRPDITVSQRVLSAFRAGPLTARQAYEALGVSNQCGSRLLANAITNLCLHGQLRADDSKPRRYRFITDTSQPLPAALRAKQKAESNARNAVLRELSHRRRIQAEQDAQLRKARRRGTGINITTARIGSPYTRPQLASGQTESIEQFLARGGQVETLSHNFDKRHTSFPGRRPSATIRHHTGTP